MSIDPGVILALVVKLYLGWSGIKEDSGRREGEEKLGDRNKETSELPPQKISFRPKQSGQ